MDSIDMLLGYDVNIKQDKPLFIIANMFITTIIILYSVGIYKNLIVSASVLVIFACLAYTFVYKRNSLKISNNIIFTLLNLSLFIILLL